MDMRDIFEDKKPSFTFEIFPPKGVGNLDGIYATVDALASLAPDLISVTYGAGGSSRDNTIDIASSIQNRYALTAVAHLTCVGSTLEEIDRILAELKRKGVHNILALRGDEVPGRERAHVFEHASDLVAFIKEKEPDFNVIGACYPEGHTEAKTLAADIRNLKTKVDAGASELISQLFFDNALFYRFLERCEIAGINVPIEAGIMPVTNKAQIERMVTMCGATLPIKFQRAIAKYGDTPESMRDIGIAYAVDQIADLLANGVDGIHVYTMNNPYIAKKIAEAVKTLL